MSARLRPVNEAARRIQAVLLEVGAEFREARLQTSRTQEDVARALGVSRQFVMRVELGRQPDVSTAYLARHAAAVGLRLHMRAYPADEATRDAPQLQVITRLLATIGPAWRQSPEYGISITGDRRAWDTVLVPAGASRPQVGVEAITRGRDLQGQIRPIQAKLRDSTVDRAVIVFGDSKNNRRFLHDFRHLLRDDFPLDTRAVLSALRRGEAPAANGIVVL